MNANLARRYYSRLVGALQEYERCACEEAEEYERAGVEESTIKLGSAMVPVSLAMITFAKLIRRPRYNTCHAVFSDSVEDMKEEIEVAEKFLVSLPGAELPECPESVDKWLGKKRGKKIA